MVKFDVNRNVSPGDIPIYICRFSSDNVYSPLHLSLSHRNYMGAGAIQITKGKLHCIGNKKPSLNAEVKLLKAEILYLTV
jgi:hypothetical protein